MNSLTKHNRLGACAEILYVISITVIILELYGGASVTLQLSVSHSIVCGSSEGGWRRMTRQTYIFRVM